ncbi:MAG TPA: GTP-binding protein, partial [Aquificaceae bacterium]|nr:GTP-binding protein [Aquificaceae bacterium]
MNNRVVIIGRPNVGKSTLFNRIIGRRYAIVEDYPGVTRDKIEAKASWRGKEFIIVDTGGLIPETKDQLIREVKKVVENEIPKADVILFVVDGKDGINPLDEEIAKY